MKTVHRIEVPIDGAVHEFEIGPVVHVDCRLSSPYQTVDVWYLHGDRLPNDRRAFRVFGTGYEIPDRATWVGTALSPEGPFSPRGAYVWHLFEIPEGGLS